jgi:hypothetical protein
MNFSDDSSTCEGENECDLSSRETEAVVCETAELKR